MSARGLAFALAVLASACAPDALYTYCDADAQCGSRTYELDEDRQLVVSLVCLEASVEVAPGDTTVGNFCTLDCARDSDCESLIGLRDGACIRWAGDALAYCYQRCNEAQDCYPSSRCEAVSRDGRALQVCLPSRR